MRIRPAEEADRDRFVAAILTAFGTAPEDPVPDTGHWWSAFEMDRGLVAEADGAVVGTAAAYSFELTLPGGAAVPVAGITSVGVLPSHRRQGILTAMMRRQLTGLRESGEAMAVLLASEAVIYRRFGYGPATFTQQLTVQRHRAAIPGGPSAGAVGVRTRAECGELLPRLYDDYRRTQPGAISRPPLWWARGSGTPAGRPHPAADRGAPRTGRPAGRLRQLPGGHAGPADPGQGAHRGRNDRVRPGRRRGALQVLRRARPGHRGGLHHPATGHLAAVAAGRLPGGRGDQGPGLAVGAPARHPRSLTARGYPVDGELIIEVGDALFADSSGRYALSVSGGEATCVRTDREPDLVLDVGDLGSLYLGGLTATALAHAGRVRPVAGDALERADSLFRSPVTPHTVHWF